MKIPATELTKTTHMDDIFDFTQIMNACINHIYPRQWISTENNAVIIYICITRVKKTRNKRASFPSCPDDKWYACFLKAGKLVKEAA